MGEKFAHIENEMSQYAFWTNYIDWREPTPEDDPDSYGEVYVLATDYAALEAERDEWKRRCEAMTGIYEDANLSERVANEYIVDPTPEQVREVQYVLARVSRIHRAIAQGRDNG